MKFLISDPKENIVSFMRRCGYQFDHEDRATGEISFVRRIIAGEYPRFHVYTRFLEDHDEWEMNLHLDQKEPSYEVGTAHGGEYAGVLVESEAARIQGLVHPEAEKEREKEEFLDHETMFGV